LNVVPERRPPDTGSERATIASAVEGDPQACALLVRTYLRRAMAVAIEFMPTREDAEDVVQDAFRSAFAGLHRFDADRPFAPWFFTIVRNTARNALDSQRVRAHEELAPDHAAEGDTPLDSAHRRELRRAIEAAIDSLPEAQRTCFRLCVVEGLTGAEAAAASGVAESTVRVHVFRARKSLRALLERWRDEAG
jgi:RNA polymerase sigma-70 factor (ECF subfamily)